MMTASATPLSSLAGLNPMKLFKGIAQSYALAQEYQHKFSLSDADLAARGLTRQALIEAFIKDAGKD